MTTRAYVVGLPVILTVQPDGAIFAEVDLSDVSGSLSETQDFSTEQYPDEIVAADDTLIAAACDRIRNSITHRIA